MTRWQDVTGERYHFPNGYRNKVLPGREFVYYKGARRAGGRQSPEYFGWGRIGSVYEDPETASEPAGRRKWIAEIQDYYEFEDPVPAKRNGKYIELLSESPPSNYWRDGVREITDIAFKGILNAGGVSLGRDTITKPHNINLVVPEATAIDNPSDILVVARKRRGASASGSTKSFDRRSGQKWTPKLGHSLK